MQITFFTYILIKALIDANANVNSLDNIGNPPLRHTILNRSRLSTELLLDAGAKIGNLKESVPEWVTDIITKRTYIVKSLTVFSGVLRRRYQVVDKSTEHIGYHVPLDIVMLLCKNAWEQRFNELWEINKGYE